ncbi:unnamed protein product [Mytilus edulis]|uniref:Uncharacterized protein n=1 Tax=Mytilus edulis TaxID=6550 RepID=A0A8S3VHF2_MYTED|nr:unnamed protein product [Mytilus edulis]
MCRLLFVPQHVVTQAVRGGFRLFVPQHVVTQAVRGGWPRGCLYHNMWLLKQFVEGMAQRLFVPQHVVTQAVHGGDGPEVVCTTTCGYSSSSWRGWPRGCCLYHNMWLLKQFMEVVCTTTWDQAVRGGDGPEVVCTTTCGYSSSSWRMAQRLFVPQHVVTQAVRGGDGPEVVCTTTCGYSSSSWRGWPRGCLYHNMWLLKQFVEGMAQRLFVPQHVVTQAVHGGMAQRLFVPQHVVTQAVHGGMAQRLFVPQHVVTQAVHGGWPRGCLYHNMWLLKQFMEDDPEVVCTTTCGYSSSSWRDDPEVVCTTTCGYSSSSWRG